MPLSQPSLTASVNASNFAVTLIVSAPGATKATVFRKDNNPYVGASPVRSAIDVPTPGGFWYGSDWEIPQSDELSYYVESTDGADTRVSPIITIAGLDLGYDRIATYDSPLTGMPINVEKIDSWKHEAIQESARPLGRRDTVTVTYGRSMPNGQINFITLTDAERLQFMQIVSAGRIVMFQPRKNFGFEEALFLSVGGVVEKRVAPRGGDPVRVFECEVTGTLPPPAQFLVPVGTQWIDKQEQGDTWNDVATAGITWLEYSGVGA